MVWAVFSFFVLLFTHLGGIGKISYKNRVFFRICLIITLSIMTGLGSLVGQDHSTYVNIYKETTTINTDNTLLFFFTNYSIEPGFQLLNVLGNSIHIPEPLFFFILACIMNSLYVSVIYRYSTPMMAILAFVLSAAFFQEVNILRQSLAISIILFSTKYLYNHKVWWFVVGVLIATSIHISSIICVMLIFLSFIDYNNRSKAIFMIFFFLWFLSLLSVIGFSIPIMGSVSNLLADSRYEDKFLENDTLGYDVRQFNLFYNVLMILVLLSMKKKASIVSIIIALGCILQNFSSQMAPLIRMSIFFTTMMPLAIGSIFNPVNYHTDYKKYVCSAKKLIFIYYIYVLVFGYILGSPILGSNFY